MGCGADRTLPSAMMSSDRSDVIKEIIAEFVKQHHLWPVLRHTDFPIRYRSAAVVKLTGDTTSRLGYVGVSAMYTLFVA